MFQSVLVDDFKASFSKKFIGVNLEKRRIIPTENFKWWLL